MNDNLSWYQEMKGAVFEFTVLNEDINLMDGSGMKI